MNVSGKRVVVTGVIAGESRGSAEAKLRDAGAIIQSGVTKETDLLVTGGKVGASKMRKAEQFGVAIVPWEQAFAPAPAAGRPPRPIARALARTVAPMLAKAGDLPTGEGWLFEIKWDGHRGIATVAEGAVALQSRSGRSDPTDQFPHVVEALSALPDCVLDGELVVLDANGESSFEAFSGGVARYVVFDVLEANGVDIRSWALTDRRAVLEALIADGDVLARSPAFEDGETLLAWAAERRLEGIMAKRTNSPYREGTRTEAWLKIKLRCEQEFVVVGWRAGEGAMAGAAGSLLLAVNDDAGRLAYVGRVGTGGTYADWEAYTKLTTPAPQAENVDTGEAPPAELRDVVWVEPELVVQVRFQRWTEDGRLWHPSVTGIRHDKPAAEVRREATAQVHESRRRRG